MNKINTIVVVASWEPRFQIGLKRLLDETRASNVLMYYFEEYRERTLEGREAIQLMAQSRGFNLAIERLTFERPAESWRTLQATLHTEPKYHGSVLVDITTMPRGTIWSVLFWLDEAEVPIHFAYHPPEKYSIDWLSRDPNEPRFAFKMAGTPRLNRPTAILAVTGYDSDRVAQAVEYFEPSRTVLAVQVGEQFDNLKRNIEVHKNIALRNHQIDWCEINSFAENQGYEEIFDVAGELVADFNVIMLSFGPKLSALSLYRVKREFSETALAYINCKDYNESYSVGIGDTIRGSLQLVSTSANIDVSES